MPEIVAQEQCKYGYMGGRGSYKSIYKSFKTNYETRDNRERSFVVV